MSNDKKTIIINELNLKDARKYRDQLDETVEKYELAYHRESDAVKKAELEKKANAAFEQAERIHERVLELESLKRQNRQEAMEITTNTLKIMGLSALTVAILAAGAYKIGEIFGENLKVSGNNPTQEQPLTQDNSVLLVENQKVNQIETIESVLADYNLNHDNNAELIQAYLSNQTFTNLNDYTQAIESFSSALIHSYRNGDVRMLDIAIANQPSLEAQSELTATKNFIAPYIINPSEPNAVKWAVGAKRAMNDGIVTEDYRILDGTAVHETQMLLFEMVWPVIAENQHDNLKYDETQISPDLVSDIPLAINAPVYVSLVNVKDSLNNDYSFMVKKRGAAMTNDCNEARTR